MRLIFFGLTITSSWGNGHATTYRALLRALAARGHRIHFIEKDVEWYRNNRDLPDPECCTVHYYEDWSADARRLLMLARGADAVVVGSYFPDAPAVTRSLLGQGDDTVFFYDIDTPVTVSRLRRGEPVEYLDPGLIPHYSAYLSFTGGPILRELEERFGSALAVPLYCSVDSDAYQPVSQDPRFGCELSYLGTYASDRQKKLDRLLNRTAASLPQSRFIVAGPQYPATVTWSSNVTRIIHLSPREHPAFYSSSRFTLNLTRDDMIAAGYSPSVRLFEASACGAAILSDSWPGLAEFLTPGEEILIPADASDVREILRSTSEQERRLIGRRARQRILERHTSVHRAMEFEAIVDRCSSHSLQAQTASSSSE